MLCWRNSGSRGIISFSPHEFPKTRRNAATLLGQTDPKIRFGAKLQQALFKCVYTLELLAISGMK